MKAVIYNSGLGKRMGELTANNPKSMVKLSNGETIFERQIRILSECGIKDFLVTTGPFEEQLIEVSKSFSKLNFTFVRNPIYDKTNYIYSMYLARQYFDDDVLMLHGDLVFDKKLIVDILSDQRTNLATVNRSKPLPEKDFKARVIDGKIKEVSINIFDSNCYAFQPCYKLSCDNIQKWLNIVSQFIKEGIDNVYAENAFNSVSDNIPIEEFNYENYYIDEVDNPEDLKRVSNEIRYYDFREQTVSETNNYKEVLFNSLKTINNPKVLIVSNSMFANSNLKSILEKLKIEYIVFNKYSPNPKYEELVEGINLFNKNNCNFIISYGGGSAIDIAKCIKIYANVGNNYCVNNIKHLSIPTTAGTGSESTRFAVIYKDGVKTSIANDRMLPDYVMLDYNNLLNLPDYQKKSTMLDALCQGIESYWSINSTSESKKYAKNAITLITKNMFKYLENDKDAAKDVMMASNFSGKAINISETTAAHAMSYKITSLFGTSHGHAVALCLPYIWDFMIHNMDKCIDPRGEKYIVKIMNELSEMLECNNPIEAIKKFKSIISKFNLNVPTPSKEEQIELVNSVNEQRLKNNPIRLSKEDISNIYAKVLKYKRK